MYGSPEQALYVLDQAADVRARADVTWRSAIRQALASKASIDQIADRAHTTVEQILAIVATPPQAPKSESPRSGGCFPRNAGRW
ncbi:hypothetical protein GCM10022251_46480 [Phytohabitans flavus]|uniref:Uncharacterized protein n=1 Tax=Phytohabitans flavus TaxID=1076124 RepID=A0A6F8Y7W8_9ACTN|nr:hypothetical protein [Phytohabitans flavus]BCB82214.1 hypothetical protein Pflav_086240 [Phytohabitans flavus]